MKIGYVQFKPVFSKKEKNIERLLKFLKEGAKKEADLLVLPELCNTGYVFKSREEVESLSEEIPEGKTTKTLMAYAENFNLHIVAGLCEKKDERFFDSAILVGPDGFVDAYRKAHLFNEEKMWFTEGSEPFKVYTAKIKIGIIICFDWFFPEVIRILALKGAQIIAHPSNLVLPYCQTAVLGAAIQNRIFIVTANRTGIERGIKFTGQSQIVSPCMKVLAKSSKRKEEVIVVEVDPHEADSKKITSLNDAWDDRRIDLYKPLLESE